MCKLSAHKKSVAKIVGSGWGVQTYKIANQQNIRSDVTVMICGHNKISMLCNNKLYCVELSSEDLSRYSKTVNQLV